MRKWVSVASGSGSLSVRCHNTYMTSLMFISSDGETHGVAFSHRQRIFIKMFSQQFSLTSFHVHKAMPQYR